MRLLELKSSRDVYEELKGIYFHSVCIYIYRYLFIYAYLFIYIYMCVYKHSYIYIYIYICMALRCRVRDVLEFAELWVGGAWGFGFRVLGF